MSKKIGFIIIALLIAGVIGFWLFQSKSTHSSNVIQHRESLPVAFSSLLDEAMNGYFDIQKLLSKDQLSVAKNKSQQLSDQLEVYIKQGQIFEKGSHWENEKNVLLTAYQNMADAKTIEDARKHFEALSRSIENLVIHYGGPKDVSIFKYKCPMVDNNRGASWLQNVTGTQNPYYGSQMFNCGSKVKDLQ